MRGAAGTAHAVRWVAVFEAAKGMLGIVVAVAVLSIGPEALSRGWKALLRALHLSTDRGAGAWLAERITIDNVSLAAAIAVVYASIRFIEAWGLWHRRRWASWLGCIGAAIYLPFDVLALVQVPGAITLSILGINLLIVGVLWHDLRRHRLA
ncbi:MAG: DUF2127 domain-containing protein [Pseudomonadota bacterium]